MVLDHSRESGNYPEAHLSSGQDQVPFVSCCLSDCECQSWLFTVIMLPGGSSDQA